MRSVRHAVSAKRTACGSAAFASSRHPGALCRNLATILASHALIHTAEGEFYRDAILAAAQALTLKATRLKAVEAHSHVAMRTGMGEGAITKALRAIGKSVGPPWTSDEKLATLAAWSLLAN